MKGYLCLLVLALISVSLVSGQSDADKKLDTLGLIKERGYQVESIQATTSDGYILTLHRIPNPGKPVVLLQHGLLDTSATWVINGRSRSLGYVLNSRNYDVYLANSRGNKYSQAHRSLSTGSSQFWDFTFDQHALLDIPASIAAVLKSSGQKKLILISHSQGATASLIALGSKPELASQVSLFIALAPVTYLKSQTSAVLNALGKVHADALLAVIGNREIIPAPDQLAKLLGKGCSLVPDACAFSASLLFGPSSHEDKARTGVFASHWPDRTSVKNMRQWIQNARTGGFNSFEGKDYTSILSKFPVPVAVYSAGKDRLGDSGDIAKLKSVLRSSGKLVHELVTPDYSHMDYTWAKDATSVIYTDVITLMDKYNKN